MLTARQKTIMTRWAQALLVPLFGVLAAPALSDSSERFQDERAQFKSAWQSAARGDVTALRAAIDALPEYPLTPYLEFEYKRQRIESISESDMTRFLARYRDWSFAGRLEAAWLGSLARNGRYDALLRHGSGSNDVTVRCHLARARLAAGRNDGVADEARTLWLSPNSRPKACDPLFAWWRRQGNPDVDTGWERFGLAVEAGEYRLASYLERYLDPADRLLAAGWVKLARNPNQGLAEARQWPDRERSRQLAAWGLHRLASSDWARARDWYERLARHLSFTQAEVGPALRRMALFQALDLDPGAVAAIDGLPDELIDDQLLQWRLRAALGNGDWPAVLESVQRMSAAEQLRERWRYWRGRALAELGRPEAGLVLATLATEADYYGFLAALRSGQPLTLCSRDIVADGEVQLRLLRDAEFDRAIELFHVGRAGDARWTWNRVSRRLSAPEQRQAALLAAGIGWHDRAIVALASAGATNAYRWRFPIVERERVEAHAATHGVDAALILGLMRAESAMQADARSPAGARGLLQLMEPTAAAVARRFALPYSGPADLYRPDRNIALGVAHLGELQQRFGGDFTRVAAAYNAGPSAAQRWQTQRAGLPTDIWMETLPFYETRDYVPRVLAFATVYEWQLGRQPRVLAENVLGQTSTSAVFGCPADPGRSASAAAE